MNKSAETTRKGMKKKFVDELAKTVIETARSGKWSVSMAELSEDSTADDIAKVAFSTAMRKIYGERGNVPEWFGCCIDATKTVLKEDEMQGFECVAALYMAAENAAPEQKMEALGALLCVLDPPTTATALGMFGGADNG